MPAAAYVVWGGWLVVTMLTFSLMAGIFHEYYTVALAWPSARSSAWAPEGAGTPRARRRLRHLGPRRPPRRPRSPPALAGRLAAVAAGRRARPGPASPSCSWPSRSLHRRWPGRPRRGTRRRPGGPRGIQRGHGLDRPHRLHRHRRSGHGRRPRGHGRGPGAAARRDHGGRRPRTGSHRRRGHGRAPGRENTRHRGRGGPVRGLRHLHLGGRRGRLAERGRLQLATELPVMAIGGFNGSDPSPTLEQFGARRGREVHYFAAGGGSRAAWAPVAESAAAARSRRGCSRTSRR